MEISYDYYKIFYYVARYGGFSQAAEALMRAQPNISKTVKNLENQLGCKLLVRTSRGVSLTPEGEKLYRHLDFAFRHISAGENEIVSAGNLSSGTLSIATTEMAFYCCALNAVTAFNKDHSGVKIKLTNLNNRDALAMLKNGLADLALLSGMDKQDSSFSYSKINDFKEILCAKKGYLKSESFDINKMEKYTYISLDKSTYSYEIYRNYFLSIGLSPDPDIEVATETQVLNAVRCGAGIGFVVESVARELIDKGEIEELVLKQPIKHREIYLVEDKGRSLCAAARKFKEYLK